jgi:hypothetical protein
LDTGFGPKEALRRSVQDIALSFPFNAGPIDDDTWYLTKDTVGIEISIAHNDQNSNQTVAQAVVEALAHGAGCSEQNMIWKILLRLSQNPKSFPNRYQQCY